ncbi:alpha/beta hydrolase [soil metagenome]
MTDYNPHRRALLAGGLGLGLAALAGPALAASEVVTIKAGARDMALTVWRPAKAKGVVVFSHAAGAAPAAYDGLAKTWTAAGFLVVAPMHVDSLSHPSHSDYTLQTAFPLRLEDFGAAAAWSTQAAPGLPRGAAGHSYGSLMAMMQGGAMEPMIPARDPATKAVLAFSSPGVIPGLIGPAAYAKLDVPLLLLTGDKDVVPGFVPDWHDHLRAFETSPAGDKHAWIGAGVDHMYGGAILGAGKDPAQTAAFAEGQALSTVFLRAAVLGEAAAKAQLTAAKSSPVAEILTR